MQVGSVAEAPKKMILEVFGSCEQCLMNPRLHVQTACFEYTTASEMRCLVWWKPCLLHYLGCRKVGNKTHPASEAELTIHSTANLQQQAD